MNYIEKLLDGVEVEWKPFGEVVRIQRGRRLVKSELEEFGNYAVFQNSMIPLGYYHKSNVQADTTFIISAGAAGEIGYSCVEFWAADDVYYFTTPEKLTSKFLYYFLLTQQTIISGQVRRASVPRLSKVVFERILVPIPPLSVQKEIVRILDKFTALTAALTAELAARKKQYSYYRETLLSFEEGEVEWKTLREIGEIKRGVAFTKKQAVFGGYPVIANAAEPISFHNEFNRNGKFIVVARSGANAGLISYWSEELFLTDAFSIHPDESILNTKFAFYFLKKYQREIHLMKRGSGVPHVRASDFEIYKIPVPTLEEQERIVTILDKFDILTTSISEGLPKEIELRKKQYEYYRDLLLTFPKNNTAS